MDKSAKSLVATKKHLALISPLDWGLGHTTRCIPIIKELLNQEISVVIACNSVQKALLIREFPDLDYIPLSGYGLTYGKTRRDTIFRLCLQIPKILISIKRENLQLKRILNTLKPDFIISDNRYGFRSKSIPSYFITHQLKILSGTTTIADQLIRSITYSWINKFRECWVPDYGDDSRLAGKLSTPSSGININVQYLGPLSRFEPCTGLPSNDYVLIVLSGPEPQRTMLETILIEQASRIKRNFIMVRGLPLDVKDLKTPANIRSINFADSRQLNRLVCQAGVVVCRPGYTSVMDLAMLQKQAIFIPTPGQGEQEYLGKYLGGKGSAVICNQEFVNLNDALIEASKLQPKKLNMQLYKNVITKLVYQIKEGSSIST